MHIRVEDTWSEASLDFLKRCYKFVNHEWQHTRRESLPDQGFEQRFRESCILQLSGWSTSQEREMHLGYGVDTASGVSHEVDIVAQHPDVTAILEMKNRHGDPPGKNDVIVFFAKVFDYVAFNPMLLLKDVCLAFLSNTEFDQSGLAACLGLGIHPITPSLRPLPILISNARIIAGELQQGLVVAPHIYQEFEDFCAELNRISSTLSNTWLGARCGYQSEDRIVMRAVGGLPTLLLAQKLRELNGDCSRLIEEAKMAKARARS